jgi:hypothetical protein
MRIAFPVFAESFQLSEGTFSGKTIPPPSRPHSLMDSSRMCERFGEARFNYQAGNIFLKVKFG